MDMDVFRDNKVFRLMPTCAVTNQEYFFLVVMFGQLLQKYVHTNGIAPWQNQKETVSGARVDRAIRIAVLSDMMARYSGPAASRPAILILLSG